MKTPPRFWMLLCCLIAVLAMAGCGGGDDEGGGDPGASAETNQQEAPFPTEQVELEMWWWGEQEAKGAKKWLNETIRLYEKERPNVKIKPVLQTTDGLVPSFQAAAQAKKGPDIQYFWGGIWTLENAWNDAITPISDHLPKEEIDNFINAQEVTYDGKVWSAGWYVQPSFPVLYRKDVLEKAGVEPPQNWDELLAACKALNAEGVTPMAGGIKDGWFGGWLYSMIGAQEVESVGDVIQAVVGEQKFTDPQHAAYWTRLKEMRDNDCWNDDINSLELYQGQQRWSRGDAAMTVVAGSDVMKFIEEVGEDNVGVMAMPKWGEGPFAGKLGSTSQTLGITKWSKYPQVAADFIKFMKTPDRLNAWFTTTGSYPADERFDPELIENEQQRELFEMVKDGAPYLENFLPTQLDSEAIFSNSQLVLSGDKEPAKAAQDTEALAERLRRTQRKQMENFRKWAESYSDQ